MTETASVADARLAAARPTSAARLPRVVFTHRGDPLVPYLGRALREGFDVVAEVEADISHVSRMMVAAATVRPNQSQWGQRYIKSRLGIAARSRRVRRRLASGVPDHDVVFQTHALYRVDDPRTVLYVDCTHRQSVAHWPAWNPLRGRALDRWLERERRQYHAAAHVFAFSEATRRSLLHEYDVPEDRVSVVGAGLDFEQLPPAADPAPADPSAPVLLFVGNDFRRKGGPELLAAFARVRRTIPGARLRLVGSGCPTIERPGVEVLGPITDRDRLSQIYSEATVFCLPARFEPFGLVLLEAMAHGLPCVVSDSCGIPDIVVDDETGVVLDGGGFSVEDLTQSLLDLLASPEALHRLGAAGRLRVRERFLWSQVVERMRPVLEELAARPRPSSVPAGGLSPAAQALLAPVPQTAPASDQPTDLTADPRSPGATP